MSAFRFLPGLVIVQIATAALVIAGGSAPAQVNWALVAVAAAVTTLVVAFWFSSIAENARKDTLAEAREKFARERERLVVTTEAEKRTLVEENHRRMVQATNRAHARANFKLGAAVAGLVGIAAALLYIELFTLALVTLTTAGGALVGYVARARQEAQALRRHRAELPVLPGTYTLEPAGNDQRAAASAMVRDRGKL